jgi:hypothetical protein
VIFALFTAGCSSDLFECNDSFGAGACPALVDVNGVRYGVNGAVNLVNVEEHLIPHGQMVGGSVAYFSDSTAFAIEGVDPLVYLVGRNSDDDPEEPGEFRELWSVAGHPFPVGLCVYLTADRRADLEDCNP